MFLKRLVPLAALLCLALPALAQPQPPVPTYVIKKGDTLWGISQRFLSDPFYWPNLWADNPFITNPHLIYPGQTLALIDGQLVLLPADVQLPQTAPASSAPPAPAFAAQPLPVPSEAITVKAYGGARGFVSTEELQEAGTLIDTVDSRIMLGTGDEVFLDLRQLGAARPGMLFALYEIGRPLDHPLTRDPIGVMVTEVGAVAVTEITPSVAVGTITAAHREIHRGAILLPPVPELTEIALRRATRPVVGTLLAGSNEKVALGQYDIIYLDRGHVDGLQPGNLLTISRPRTPSELGLVDHDKELPDSLLGSAVVVDTRARTAAALVLKSVEPLERGDKLVALPE
jgi:LysM domain